MTLGIKLWTSFTDTSYKALADMAMTRQETARAPGTMAHYQRVKREYVKFCIDTDIDPLSPSSMDVCVFIEHLMLKKPSPATVKNKISVVRKYITLSQGELAGINSLWVKQALDAISRTKYHSVREKKPMCVKNFRNIILDLPNDFKSLNIKTMLLLLYYTAFRQSELAPKKMDSFDQERNLCKSDISFRKGCLYINLRCAKNLQRFNDHREICIPAVTDKRLCPVYNLRKIFSMVRHKKGSDPVFVFHDKTPVSSNYLRTRWKQCLKQRGLDSKVHSLHSIRSTAASEAYQAGFSSLDVKRFGGWSSEAHLKYIRTHTQKSVSMALGQIITKWLFIHIYFPIYLYIITLLYNYSLLCLAVLGHHFILFHFQVFIL